MENAVIEYGNCLLNEITEECRLDDYIEKNKKCEVIIDYIVDWFNQNCKIESIDGTDILFVKFEKKYYNKKFNFTHGIIQNVRGIYRKIDGDERYDLYLLSDTFSDKNFHSPEATDADKKFIKYLKDNDFGDEFMYELEHLICGFCFDELVVLLNIILDKKENLIEAD